MSRHEYDELLGAYSLHSTEPREGAEVEAHLAQCPRCRAEVKSHRELAALLAALLADGGREAPPRLWGKIARSIADESPPSLRQPSSTGRAGHPPAPATPLAGRRGRGRAQGHLDFIPGMVGGRRARAHGAGGFILHPGKVLWHRLSGR
jgi:anti-sigma factor RsiW